MKCRWLDIRTGLREQCGNPAAFTHPGSQLTYCRPHAFRITMSLGIELVEFPAIPTPEVRANQDDVLRYIQSWLVGSGLPVVKDTDRKYCAWHEPTPAEPVSHSICEECSERELAVYFASKAIH